MNETKLASFRAKLEESRFALIGEVREKYKQKKMISMNKLLT